MMFSICKRVFSNRWGCFNSCSDRCPYHVRRNASSNNRPFSSNTLRRSSHPNQTLVESKSALAVSSLLRDYGFSDAHISEVARRCPSLFTLRAQSNILPKLKFLGSIGLSNADLPKLVLRVPYVLSSSLHNQLIPCCDYLVKGVPLDNGQLTRTLNYFPRILLSKVETVLAPNVEVLKSKGMSPSSIASLVMHYTSMICRNNETFKSSVNQTVEMGLCPSAKSFIPGLHILCNFSKENWGRKMKLYRSFGLSDEEILLAFRKQPMIMHLSAKNIEMKLEFFLNELSWAPSALVNTPVMMLFSLEKRVIPRCRVMEELVKRGLAPKVSTQTLLKLSEKFLNRFIHAYDEEFPEIVDVYGKKYVFSDKNGSLDSFRLNA